MRGRRIFKALPSVYEDALSYYEVLSKLIGCVGELQEIINGDNTEIIKKLLNECIFRCSYDQPNETIVFGYEVIEGGEEIHTYDNKDNTLYITSKE